MTAMASLELSPSSGKQWTRSSSYPRLPTLDSSFLGFPRQPTNLALFQSCSDFQFWI